MARLRTNVLKWGNKYDGPNDYKHGRRGALDDALWDEDELVDYRRIGGKKKTKKPKSKGCWANNGKGHVYVWVEETYRGLFSTYTYDKKVCCGCLKVAKHKYRKRIY